MSTDIEMSDAEYEAIVSDLKAIPSDAYDMEYNTLAMLDKILRELPDDWKGEAANEYMSRLNATRDHLARCIEAMYRVAEDAVIEIDNKYTHQNSSG